MAMWDEIQNALSAARAANYAADEHASEMASLLKNRLRHVKSGRDLAALKRELQNFDMRTHTWKS